MTWLIQWWQRLSRRQQAAVLLAGGLLILWVVDAVVLRPLRMHVRELHRQVHETEQRLLQAVAASQQAEQVNKAFAAYEAYAHPAGPQESELAQVLTEVESAVRQSGMTLLNLKPATPRQASDSTVSVTVESEASPGQFVHFLDQIQRSTHLLKVTELTVRTSAEGKALRTSMIVSKLLLK